MRNNKLLIYKSGETVRDMMQSLAKERKRKGIVQQEVATKLSTTKGNISRMEQGHHYPTFRSIINYVDSLGVDIEIFVKPKL